eukprot:3932416-Rhodomonas_salina.1
MVGVVARVRVRRRRCRRRRARLQIRPFAFAGGSAGGGLAGVPFRPGCRLNSRTHDTGRLGD